MTSTNDEIQKDFKGLTANSAECYLHEHRVRTMILYKVVVVSFFVVLVSLPFIYVDITISAVGSVRPVHERTNVTAITSEYVDSVYVSEGDELAKGDTILTQRSVKNESQYRFQRDVMDELSRKISDLECLLKNVVPKTFKSDEVCQEYLHYLSQLQRSNMDCEQYQLEHGRCKNLLDSNVISRSEYETAYYQYVDKTNSRDILVKSQMSKWRSALRDYIKQLDETNANLKGLTSDKQMYVVQSPVNGTLEQFNGIYRGCSVTSGQVIAVISPNGGMCVETYVSPRDIAFIRDGMKVRVRIDALNYNEWGVIHGHVQSISSDLVQVNDSYYYKVKCNMDRNYLTLKDSNRRALVKKGMSASAHFMVTKQSLFTLLYKNIDEWINPTQKNS